jgi:Tol biopolymer transport system component
MRRVGVAGLAMVFGLLFAAGGAVPAAAGLTVAGAAATGTARSATQADGDSGSPLVSGQGRFIVFSSEASNLVPGDTNGGWDVFIRDRWCATTRRVSVTGDGRQAHGDSGSVAVSPDARFVVLSSDASDLVPGDTNGSADVFVRDRLRGTTQRISLSTDGVEGNSASSGSGAMSADGRYVAFLSFASNLVPADTNSTWDLFVRDLHTATTSRVSAGPGDQQADGASYDPAFSADGRYLAFMSDAANLVPGDTDRSWDVFVRDLTHQTIRRVSVAADGGQANGGSGTPSISADGRYVAFFSDASNLVPADTNTAGDVFVRDLTRGTTRRVSVGAAGAQSNGPADGYPKISGDGRYVMFGSLATNLVPGDTNNAQDIFIRDLTTATTSRLNVATTGTQANAGQIGLSAAMDTTGRYVTFASTASNLVPADTNDATDIFLRDLNRHTTQRISIPNPTTGPSDQLATGTPVNQPRLCSPGPPGARDR